MMATPSGPCLSPWRNSLAERLYRIRKRKPVDAQSVPSPAKRRCFPSYALPSPQRQPPVRQGSPAREQRVPASPTNCGQDSLLHDPEGAVPTLTDCRSKVMTDVDMDDVTAPGIDGRLRARVEELTNTLQFMQEHDISSNDYWAVPQESQTAMMEELEQARIAIDSDCVPDPEQYRPSNNNTRNNTVQIFCKPSSDDILDPPHFF